MQPVWVLDKDVAILQADRLSARIELDRPDRGICELALDKSNLPGCHLLRLAWPPGPSTGSIGALADSYVRHNDLIVTYTEARDANTSQVYYRYFETDTRDPGIDLVLSRQTELLDSNPLIVVSSLLPPGETLCLAGHEIRTMNVQPDESVETKSCLFVHRFARQWSYVETIHPGDLETSIVRTTPDAVQLDRTLFQHRLEKGVIRRGQIRCAFVERRRDVSMALELFERLNRSEPPLTT
jgi:hypothetical protein